MIKRCSLLFAHKTIKSLLFVVLLSQFLTVAVAALDFLPHNAYVLSQENEEPKPNKGMNAFDFLEESKFIIANFSMLTFFSDEDLHTLHIESFLFEVENTLDLPPPEVA